MKKRILSLHVALYLMIGLMTVMQINAFAQTSGYTYEVKDDKAIIVECDPAISGDVVIPSVIEGYTVAALGDGAFWGCNDITSIIIPDSVEFIGENVFYGCYSLTNIAVDEDNPYYSSIDGNLFNKDVTKLIQYAFGKTETEYTIPDSVTSIGDYAFWCCNSLTSITIPDSVTSIGNSAFWCCNSLTSITIPDSVTSIGDYAFYGCSSLTSITIPDSVTSIGERAFGYCDSLINITIGEGVTSIGSGAFEDCQSLVEIIVPDSVTSIGEATFSGCYNLMDINVDVDNQYYCSINGNLFNKDKTVMLQYAVAKKTRSYVIPEGVVRIGRGAFKYSELRSITIPDGVTSIGDEAFYWCSELQSITIPDGVTSIGDEAFRECHLRSVLLDDSVESIGEMAFDGCWELTDVYYDGTEEEWSEINIEYFNDSLTDATIHYGLNSAETSYYSYDVTDGNATITGCDTAISGNVEIPSVLDGYPVTEIGYSAFSNCHGLTGIVIPDSITSIEDCAFEKCFNLTSVEIGNKVTTIGDMAFYECHGITDITIGEGVSSIGEYAFGMCYNLINIKVDADNQSYSSDDGILFSKDKTELIRYAPGKSVAEYTVPASVTRIGDSAFEDCSGIGSILISSGVTEIRYDAFYYCTGLTRVAIGAGVTTIRSGVFNGCSNLADIDVDVDNQYYCSIDGVLFSKDKTTLLRYTPGKTVTMYVIPEEVTTIENSAFEDSDYLVNITIPDGVTSIERYAFYNCDSLTSITIPDSVTMIGRMAFAYCRDLKTAIIGNGITIIEEDLFGFCSSMTNIKIPVGVTTIGDGAFAMCGELTDVYYGGTKEEFARVDIGHYNEYFTDAVIHYNATAPIELSTAEDMVLSYNAEECTLSVNTVVKNNTASVLDGTVYAAVYSRDGKMKGIGKAKVNIDSDLQNTANMSINDYIFVKDDYIKLFIFDEDFIPQCGSIFSLLSF